jgi:acetyl-CoA carboxylase alpha subunit
MTQAGLVAEVLSRQLAQLDALEPDQLVSGRYDRFRRIGALEF